METDIFLKKRLPPGLCRNNGGGLREWIHSPPSASPSIPPFLPLTRVVDAEVFPLATVLLALGSEVGPHWIVITRSEDDTEDLLSGPQGDGLEERRGQMRARLLSSQPTSVRQEGTVGTGKPYSSTAPSTPPPTHTGPSTPLVL